jgi:hypothetical protein
MFSLLPDRRAGDNEFQLSHGRKHRPLPAAYFTARERDAEKCARFSAKIPLSTIESDRCHDFGLSQSKIIAI